MLKAPKLRQRKERGIAEPSTPSPRVAVKTVFTARRQRRKTPGTTGTAGFCTPPKPAAKMPPGGVSNKKLPTADTYHPDYRFRPPVIMLHDSSGVRTPNQRQKRSQTIGIQRAQKARCCLIWVSCSYHQWRNGC